MKTFSAITLLVVTAGIASAAPTPWPKIVAKNPFYAGHDLRGKKAPTFVVEKWLNASKVNTKGKVVVIDFWATWCGPCRASIPDLNEIAKKFKGKVVVIGVSDESPDKVKEFMKSTKMEYNVAIDTKHRMNDVLGVEGIPHVMVISPDGIVRWQGFPMDPKDPLTLSIVGQVVAASHVK